MIHVTINGIPVEVEKGTTILSAAEKIGVKIPTVYPEGLEAVPPRYAIDKRNRWMLQQSDVVVTYVTVPFGGAAKFKLLAEKTGRAVINIADSVE